VSWALSSVGLVADGVGAATGAAGTGDGVEGVTTVGLAAGMTGAEAAAVGASGLSGSTTLGTSVAGLEVLSVPDTRSLMASAIMVSSEDSAGGVVGTAFGAWAPGAVCLFWLTKFSICDLTVASSSEVDWASGPGVGVAVVEVGAGGVGAGVDAGALGAGVGVVGAGVGPGAGVVI
jgi:hypothetical protein